MISPQPAGEAAGEIARASTPIYASLLSADLGRLWEQVAELEASMEVHLMGAVALAGRLGGMLFFVEQLPHERSEDELHGEIHLSAGANDRIWP